MNGNEIKYCPMCGKQELVHYLLAGKIKCKKCDRFFVVEGAEGE